MIKNPELALKLKKTRKKLGLSQNTVGLSIGRDHSFVSKIETTGVGTFEAFEKYARAIGLKLNLNLSLINPLKKC